MAFGDKTKEKPEHPTSVHAKIAEQLTELSPRVEDLVVETLVERELTKRSEAIVQVMDMLSKCEGDLRKIKPDQISYDAHGVLVNTYWSKARLDEKTKIEERIGKLRNAIVKAIEKADLSDVYNLKNQGSSGSGNKPEADTATD